MHHLRLATTGTAAALAVLLTATQVQTATAAPPVGAAAAPTTAPATAPTAGPAAASTAVPVAARAAARTSARLTNLAHLDFLGDTVAPPRQAGHTTYDLARKPGIGVLWTYADHDADGSFRRVGGGDYDPATDTYGQGAFNADDIARAAVVYLRHWRQTRSSSSRRAAVEMLRGLTYLQTVSGPNAGNVVLWMQPDGTLNRSPKPTEQPDPSDSDASYWLARTVWALGEAYPLFQKSDPSFARFLERRLDLGVAALDRQVLDSYGRYLDIDGRRTPAWLVANGADATAEAVLGLAAYVRAGGTSQARRVLSRLSEGIAKMAGGDAQHWPFGAVRPWALSQSVWHAWASQMPAALTRASAALREPRLARVANRDSFVFDPWLLTSGGPDNGRMPTRNDGTQIAYGVDSRVQSLLAGGSRAGRQLAGVTAAWFFGANAARRPAYDPRTGVTIDGISREGKVNENSGAESTIHGLLAMLALDAHPQARRIARSATQREAVGPRLLEAEDARLSGDAVARRPTDLWTGESAWSGSGYASLRDGSTATFDAGRHGAALLLPVVELRAGGSAVTTFGTPAGTLGSVDAGAIGAQGDSPAPGALLPLTLTRVLPAGSGPITASTRAADGDESRLDALMLQPLVTRLVLAGAGHGIALLRSAASTEQRQRVTVPGRGTAHIWSYDGRGTLVGHHRSRATSVPVRVPAGGFAIVRR